MYRLLLLLSLIFVMGQQECEPPIRLSVHWDWPTYREDGMPLQEGELSYMEVWCDSNPRIAPWPDTDINIVYFTKPDSCSARACDLTGLCSSPAYISIY